MTEQIIINQLRDLAEAHLAVNYFDQGSPEFNFSAMDNVTLPLVYVQTINATEADNRTTYQFTLYCLDIPAAPIETDNTAFEWDDNYVTSRDACKSTLNDLVCELKVRNLQQYTVLNTGSLIPDGDAGDFVGWRQTVTVSFDSQYNTTDFPRPAPMQTGPTQEELNP